MGRGRNKAKAKKVARELKYNNDGVDFDSLAEELHKQSKKSGKTIKSREPKTDGVVDGE